MKVLPKRFGKYGLELHPEKTRLIDLMCATGNGDKSFDFLGFTHYMGKSQKGYPVLMRKTSSKKFTKAITNTEAWIKANRHLGIKQLIKELNVKLRGHYNYYGITFNYRGINSYYYQIERCLHKWLNRRGGRTVWTWEKFSLLIDQWIPLLRPKLYHKFV